MFFRVGYSHTLLCRDTLADLCSSRQAHHLTAEPTSQVRNQHSKTKKARHISVLLFLAPRVGFGPTTLRLTAGCSTAELTRNMKCGNSLSSRAVSSQVLSAQLSLTSVFGMETGGSSTLSSPQWLYNCFRRVYTMFSPVDLQLHSALYKFFSLFFVFKIY